MLHNRTSLTVFLGCRQAELELEGKGQNEGMGLGRDVRRWRNSSKILPLTRVRVNAHN